MTETILGSEPAIRLTAFHGVLAAKALREIAAPRRRGDIPRVIRWTNNLALIVIDTAISRLTFPVLATGLPSTHPGTLSPDRGMTSAPGKSRLAPRNNKVRTDI